MATSEAAAQHIALDRRAVRRSLVRNAGRVLGVAGVLGVVGQLLFFDVGLGINFPIAISLLLAGGWLLRRQRRRPAMLDLWLGPAAIAFATFAAVRADPFIVMLDLVTSVALAGAALASFGGRSVVALSFGGLFRLALGALGWALTGAVTAIADGRNTLPSGRSFARRARPAVPVLRGLAIAVPVVLVFVALFASADAVFARLVDDLVGIDLGLESVTWRIVLAAVLTWLAAGGLALAASAPTSSGPSVAAGSPWRLGTTEIVTVLLAVDAVFGVFVALQGAYLFGGIGTLGAIGMTYADYARRGFFELVAVAVLAGGVAILGERLARNRTRSLVAAAICLMLLTSVVLVSAALRMRLYQDAYGWTELRFYVLATIGLLAFGVIGMVVMLVTDRVRLMGHVLLTTAMGIGLVLNLIGPVRFITEQNVARVLDPSLVPARGSHGLDGIYATSLGDDAIPQLIRGLPAMDEPAASYVREMLRFRLEELRGQEGLNAWQAWNAGRASARDALEAARAEGDLP